jgi:hypothetical protein
MILRLTLERQAPRIAPVLFPQPNHHWAFPRLYESEAPKLKLPCSLAQRISTGASAKETEDLGVRSRANNNDGFRGSRDQSLPEYGV